METRETLKKFYLCYYVYVLAFARWTSSASVGVGANVLSAGFIFAANDPSTGEDALPGMSRMYDTFPSESIA